MVARAAVEKYARRIADNASDVDLIVRDPDQLRRRLELGDWFLREIRDKGDILYKRPDHRVGAEGGR